MQRTVISQEAPNKSECIVYMPGYDEGDADDADQGCEYGGVHDDDDDDNDNDANGDNDDAMTSSTMMVMMAMMMR